MMAFIVFVDVSSYPWPVSSGGQQHLDCDQGHRVQLDKNNRCIWVRNNYTVLCVAGHTKCYSRSINQLINNNNHNNTCHFAVVLLGLLNSVIFTLSILQMVIPSVFAPRKCFVNIQLTCRKHKTVLIAGTLLYFS